MTDNADRPLPAPEAGREVEERLPPLADCLMVLHQAHSELVALYLEMLDLTRAKDADPEVVVRQMQAIAARELQAALRLAESKAAADRAAQTPAEKVQLIHFVADLQAKGYQVLTNPDAPQKAH